MYSVSYYHNGHFHSFCTNSWSEALRKYDGLYQSNAKKLYIRDNEYGIKFINYQWERDENLIGWCGNY